MEDRFGQTNDAKKIQSQKELNIVVQINSSVSGDFTKMKSLCDELDALSTVFALVYVCDYGIKEKLLKAHQDERLLQFLMGLNEFLLVLGEMIYSYLLCP